jgi:hypothetical protein
MILSKLLPKKRFTMQDLIELSDVGKGEATWPSRLLIELDKMGLEIHMIEGFDGNDFVHRGEKYLYEAFGTETADWQVTHSNIEKEQQDYKELLTKSDVIVKNAIPTMDDVKRYLNDGYMVRCTVNSRKLAAEDGYVGHSVLVLSVSDNEVILHNPGLPPVPYQHVSLDIFESAWADPNEQAKEMIAVRLKTANSMRNYITYREE